VLHEAVELAGVAKTGPLMPLVSPLDAASRTRISAALRQMAADPIAA
jgi:hypothetical protein